MTSYRVLARRPGQFLRLAGPWILLRILAGGFGSIWPGYVSVAMGWLAWAAVSVSWSRFILFGNSCPVGGSLSRRERSYFLVALPMLAAALLFMIALFVWAETVGPGRIDLRAGTGLLWSITAAGLLAFLLSAARFQLMFPAVAVDDRRITFRSSFGLTRDSGLAIFVGSLGASVLHLIPTPALWLPEPPSVGLVLAVVSGFDSLMSLFTVVVTAGFSALLYARQFGPATSPSE